MRLRVFARYFFPLRLPDLASRSRLLDDRLALDTEPARGAIDPDVRIAEIFRHEYLAFLVTADHPHLRGVGRPAEALDRAGHSVVAEEPRVVWDGRETDGRTLASGVYVYSVTSGMKTVTGKVVFVR